MILIYKLSQNSYNQMSDKNIVDDFRQVCLADLRSKQASLAQLQEEWTKEIQTQCETKTQQISKILVDLEDAMVSCLRLKFKQIIQYEQARMKQEAFYLQHALNEKICARMDYLDKIISVVEGEGAGSNKLLGKIASGKIEQQSKEFNQQVYTLRISECTLSFGKQEISQLVQQIIDILHIRLPVPTLDVSPKNQNQSTSNPNKSELTQKNISRNYNPDIPFFNNSKISINSKNQSRHTLMRNQSAVSVQLEEPLEYKLNDKAIEEYKETKTIRKAKKLEQKIKQREVSPEKDVEHLMKLALERRKLLKQLE